MPPAARQNDKAIQNSPHCHGSHKSAHAPQPFPLVTELSPNIYINGKPAAKRGSKTLPCTAGGCQPVAPGFVTVGSSTVMFNGVGAARAGDVVTWPVCGPGVVLPPCSPDVDIGG